MGVFHSDVVLHNKKRIRLKELPYPFCVLGSIVEHKFMACLDVVTDIDWLYRYRITSFIVNKIMARWLVLPNIHGEVITPLEVENIVYNLEAEGYLLAQGICECRHGTGKREKGLIEGKNPNYTCIMIANWGKGHLSVYPKYYREVTAKELAETAWFWHRRGRILSGWGCREAKGFLISYCHCSPDYCIPLKNQLKRGNKVFSL